MASLCVVSTCGAAATEEVCVTVRVAASNMDEFKNIHTDWTFCNKHATQILSRMLMPTPFEIGYSVLKLCNLPLKRGL